MPFQNPDFAIFSARATQSTLRYLHAYTRASLRPCPPRGHRDDGRAAPLSPPPRPRPLPRRPRLPLLRRHGLPGPARRGGPSFRTARVVSPRVAGGAGGQVRRDRPPVWSGCGVGGRAGHVRVCPRLVGGAPVGRRGSRCVAARPSSGRPAGGASPLLARPRCRSAGVVRRGMEHAARTAGRARPRGARVGRGEGVGNSGSGGRSAGVSHGPGPESVRRWRPGGAATARDQGSGRFKQKLCDSRLK